MSFSPQQRSFGFAHNPKSLLLLLCCVSLSLSLLPKSFGQHKKQNLRSRGVLVLKVFFRCCEERHEIFFSFFFVGQVYLLPQTRERERERETQKKIWESMVWIDPSLSLFFFSPLVVHPKPPLLHIIPFVSEAFCSRERERERKKNDGALLWWWWSSPRGIVLEQLCSNTTTTL